MNEKGRSVLVQAALSGVKQAFGKFIDGDKRCAMNVLVLAHAANLDARYRTAWEEYDLSDDKQCCPECGDETCSEESLITHLNDVHRFDFIKIARSL
jgi:hypothetical protein